MSMSKKIMRLSIWFKRSILPNHLQALRAAQLLNLKLILINSNNNNSLTLNKTHSRKCLDSHHQTFIHPLQTGTTKGSQINQMGRDPLCQILWLSCNRWESRHSRWNKCTEMHRHKDFQASDLECLIQASIQVSQDPMERFQSDQDSPQLTCTLQTKE